jgi:uncharacterized protein YdgA (DUF945 family)
MEKENTSFNLRLLGLKAESGVSGETVNGAFRLSFEKLNAGGMGLGPFEMEFEARRLDADVLSRFQKLAPELRQKAAEQTQNAKGEMEKLLTQIVVDLLENSPEFEIKRLEIRTDKGDLSGRARLSFPSPGKNLAGNILTLLFSMDASAELSVSEALFYLVAENAFRGGSEQDPQSAKTRANGLVMGLMASKYIISDGGSFKSSATFKHGTLTVNGRKLGLSDLTRSAPAQ